MQERKRSMQEKSHRKSTNTEKFRTHSGKQKLFCFLGFDGAIKNGENEARKISRDQR